MGEYRSMSKTLTPLVLLFVVSSAPAAPPAIRGDHTIKPGGFAALVVEGAGKTVLWSVSPDPIQDAEFAGVLVFTGVPGTVYTATAIVIDFERKTAEKLKHQVTFSGGPLPPGPTPIPPGPTPPTPTDPFAAAIKAAAQADGWPASELRDYAGGFRACADLAKTWTRSAGQLQGAATAALKRAVDKVPARVAAAINTKLAALDTLLPAADPEHLLTDSERATVAALFLEIATALDRAAQ